MPIGRDVMAGSTGETAMTTLQLLSASDECVDHRHQAGRWLPLGSPAATDKGIKVLSLAYKPTRIVRCWPGQPPARFLPWGRCPQTRAT